MIWEEARRFLARASFESLARVGRARGDTVAAWDDSQLRLSRIQVESFRRQQEEVLGSIDFPETLPEFSALFTDDGGNIWVAAFPTPGSPREWSVFDPGGKLIGRVSTPASLEVVQVGTGFVLGRSTDGDGSERVELYELRRGRPPPANGCAVTDLAALVPPAQDAKSRSLRTQRKQRTARELRRLFPVPRSSPNP